jgi:hypothetical protein
MKLIRLSGILSVFLCLSLSAAAQTDSVGQTKITLAPIPFAPAASITAALADTSSTKKDVSDTSHHKNCCVHFFARLSSGIGFMSSTYSSTFIAGGYGGGNVSNDYIGNGYEIPLSLVLGIRIHSFKIGLGISKILFHVPSLIRTPDPSDTTTATGTAIKHQVKKFGANYIFPLFMEYDLYKINHFVLAANMNLGIFYHDRTAYDGIYAPSAQSGTSGFAYGFGLSPSYQCGHFSFFLNPCMRLTKINYYHASKEDLTDLSLNLDFGACYTF